MPTSELVAITWLRQLPGVPSTKVSTKLPGDNSLIAASGFVTVQTIGGAPHVHLPRRDPIVQVTCWACSPDGDRQDPPWAKANQLAEAIVAAVYDPKSFLGRVTTRTGYDNASVLSAYLLTEPRKADPFGTGDDARMAKYVFDLQMHWLWIPADQE